MDAYQYDKLPSDSFRYLVLLPGVDYEPLKCSLCTSRLSEVGYEAISYVWGTDLRDHDIVCDGKVLKITSNLHRALRRVRLPDTPRILWADSICINQDNLQEKSRQVILMGDIYGNAERVLICMSSSGGEHGSRVAALLKDACGMIDSSILQINKKVDERKRRGDGEPHERPWDCFPYPDASDPVLHDSRWASVSVLVKQDWFSRGWVVREAGLARHGLVIWGNTIFAWHDLMRVLLWRQYRASGKINIQDDHLRSHLVAYESRHRDFTSLLYQEADQDVYSLLNYIHVAKDLHMKDPRDRIYAFLDLAEGPTSRLNIVPNYNNAPSKVYRDFARDYVLEIGDINLLHYVNHSEDSLKSTSMTWVPDWSMREDNNFAVLARSDSFPPLTSRGGRVSEPKLLHDTTLQVEGVVIDSVNCVSNILDGNNTTVAVLFELWISVRQSKLQSHYPASELLSAFLHSLTTASYYGELNEWLNVQQAYIAVFERLSKMTDESKTINWDDEDIARLESTEYHKLIVSATSNKRFLFTERGFYGVGPAVTREGDLCGILFGCCYPSLLRESSDTDSYIYLGSGFILGKKTKILGKYGIVFTGMIGAEDSKEWKEWDVNEQTMYLS